MKFITTVIIVFACIYSSMAQLPFNTAVQNVSGTWQGTIQLNTNLRIVVHITQKADGSYTSTMDSPDQQASGIPCDETLFSNNQLSFSVKKISFSYQGNLVNDSTIQGSLKQGIRLNLDLHRTAYVTPVAVVKPQTPKPPFPYKEENVIYKNENQSLQYGGTLTLPQSGGKFPCVLLITGSGAQDRDETLFGHKPFAVLADYLTRHGYAMLRVDDRGVGSSTGSYENATTADFEKDINASINYLKTRPEINDKKIGLLGHSEGALIADMIASSRKDVKFIISLAGPGIKIKDLLVQQNKDVLVASGVNETAAEAYSGLYLNTINTLTSNSDTAVAKQAVLNIVNNWSTGKDAATLNAVRLNSPESKNAFTNAITEQFSTPWFRYFITLDPQQYLTQLRKVKVLALNGSKDVQVNAQQNIPAIQSALKEGKTKVADTQIIPGLNHLFQQCKNCSLTEYSTLEQTFSPEALNIIGNWLDKNVK